MISALAITYNEDPNIEKFIKSLSFADEIIIIDSNSTDNTVKLAKEHGASVLVRDFDTSSNQKNFAIQQANHEWVVFFEFATDMILRSQNLVLDAIEGKEILTWNPFRTTARRDDCNGIHDAAPSRLVCFIR